MPNPLWLYRVLELDDDGDPLDHGALRAATPEAAVPMLAQRLGELGFEDDLPVRLYPLIDESEGVLKSEDVFVDVRVAPLS